MQNQQQQQIIDFALSFSCYSSNSSITSTAIAKVIREEQAARFRENEDVEYEDPFEFSLLSIDEKVSTKEIDARGWTAFKLEKDDVDRHEIDASSAITIPLAKLFIGEPGETSSSYSSSESESSRSSRCGSSPRVTKCKKSSSTGSGSGSKWWIFRYLLRRSNSEGKKPKVTVLTPKKVDSPKHKRNSGEASKTGGQTPVHEQFYVQRRAENESGKKKSYLPYRKDLVGLVGMGKMLPF